MAIEDGLVWRRICIDTGFQVGPPVFEACDICERRFIDTEMYYCDCAKIICAQCVVVCKQCDAGNCPECIVECPACDVAGCKDCFIRCDKCGEYLCAEHAGEHLARCDAPGIPPLI